MLNERMMKTMKKYIKPQIQVITFNCHQSILAGSGPYTIDVYDDGFVSSAEALGREGADFDDDEDY